MAILITENKMTMKTLTAKEAKNSFGKFLDMAQREPVIITKRGRPVSVTLSVSDIQELTSDNNKLTPEISKGIEQGLKDVKAGKVVRVTAENRQSFIDEIISKLSVK